MADDTITVAANEPVDMGTVYLHPEKIPNIAPGSTQYDLKGEEDPRKSLRDWADDSNWNSVIRRIQDRRPSHEVPEPAPGNDVGSVEAPTKIADTSNGFESFFQKYRSDKAAPQEELPQGTTAAEFESSVGGFKNMYHAAVGAFNTIKDFMENPTPENSFKAAVTAGSFGSIRTLTTEELRGALGAMGGKPPSYFRKPANENTPGPQKGGELPVPDPYQLGHPDANGLSPGTRAYIEASLTQRYQQAAQKARQDTISAGRLTDKGSRHKALNEVLTELENSHIEALATFGKNSEEAKGLFQEFQSVKDLIKNIESKNPGSVTNIPTKPQEPQAQAASPRRSVAAQAGTKTRIPTAVREEIQKLDQPILGSQPSHADIIKAIKAKFPGSNISTDEFVREIDQLRGIREFMSSKPPSKFFQEQTGVPGTGEAKYSTPRDTNQGELNLLPDKRPEGWRPPELILSRDEKFGRRAMKSEYLVLNRAGRPVGHGVSEAEANKQLKQLTSNKKYNSLSIEKTEDYLNRRWEETKAAEPMSLGAAATPQGEIHYNLSLEGKVQEAAQLMGSSMSQYSVDSEALKALKTKYYYTLKRANEFDRSHRANEEILKNAKLTPSETDKSLAKGRDFLLGEADKLHKEIIQEMKSNLAAKYNKDQPNQIPQQQQQSKAEYERLLGQSTIDFAKGRANEEQLLQIRARQIIYDTKGKTRPPILDYELRTIRRRLKDLKYKGKGDES